MYERKRQPQMTASFSVKADWPRVTLAALGIVGMSISFPTVYLFSGELFPTVVRNVGVGSASMCARIGSMLAPFVTSLVSMQTVAGRKAYEYQKNILRN